MELSEVVNPHFAFPVVGVVVCAFLVFAFGFKSPVQPPSFDFDSGDDARKKKTKQRKKPHSNGQVVSSESATVTKQNITSKQPPKTAKDTKETKPKAKKVANKQVTIIEETPVDSQQNDAAGWETVSVSKKKKNKSRRDGEEQSSVVMETRPLDSRSALTPQNITQTTQISVVDEIPQQQRDRRERSGRSKEPVDLSDKENTPEITQKDKNTKQTSKDLPEKVVKSTKSAGEVSTTPVKTTDVQATKPAPKSDQKSSNSSATPKSQSAGLDIDKDAKSPKKKKEKARKEVAAVSTAESSQTSPSKPAIAPQQSAVFTSAQAAAKVKSKASSPSESAPSSSNVGAALTSEAELTVSDTPPTAKDSNVTFDEMGDWQEAKTVKKRKSKARRDN